MLGMPTSKWLTLRGREWEPHSPRTEDPFQFMGLVEESTVNRNACTSSVWDPSNIYQLPSLSKESLDILLNENILKINQDPISVAVSPSPPPEGGPVDSPKIAIATHWSGPLVGGETVVIIINPYDYESDLTIRWKDIPAFKHSKAIFFQFEEISTRKVWRSYSRLGFAFHNVPAHGSVVLKVWEGTLQRGKLDDWVDGVYPQEWTGNDIVISQSKTFSMLNNPS